MVNKNKNILFQECHLTGTTYPNPNLGGNLNVLVPQTISEFPKGNRFNYQEDYQNKKYCTYRV